jgi:hypothetical protein
MKRASPDRFVNPPRASVFGVPPRADYSLTLTPG